RTPFVLGLINPRIYLPVGLSKEEQNYILIHEQTHIRRKDHVIKTLAFLIASIHWFNPLVWIVFRLMNTDMELSCDERVLKVMNKDIRKPYANSLLSLAAGVHILNGSPLAFGEGNVKGRIKNVLNYKKFSFWVIAISVAAVIIVGIALIANPKQIRAEDKLTGDFTDVKEAENNTGYNSVKIELASEMMGFKSANEFETSDSRIVASIVSTLQSSLIPSQEDDLENNNTSRYKIELSNDTGKYSCELYYDTLYNKACIAKDGGLYEVSTDFARYIDSFLENTSITVYIDKADAAALFKEYGWTLDYQINGMNKKLDNIKALSGFNPNAYYFAYNNELSKDIGLDMSGYSDTGIDVEIYRIHESMPQEFYPIQDCRGIVVRNNSKIIGAFISAGRHSAFNACSLKGNSFEKVTGQTLNEWLADMIRADGLETSLSKLEPEQVIEKYFTALNNKDDKTAEYCISKKTLLGSLTSNMQNSELFNDSIVLPLTGADFGVRSTLDNLKSAKLLKTELFDEPDKYTKIYRVTVDLQYRNDFIISSGQQPWDCFMVYESPQTGWKIEAFGH
ncbi:MAG TPA: M56 family metallopeptidase, partial [Clostridia bacterium]